MSKIALSPNASGTGVFTIASPNGNTDRTLVLPDEAGTVLTSGTPVLAQKGTPVFRTYTNTVVNFSANTWALINLNVKAYDTHNFYDTATGKFQPTIAGYYQFNSALRFNTGVTNGYTGVSIARNTLSVEGTFGNIFNGTHIGNSGFTADALFYLNGTTDYVSVYAYTSAGVAQISSDWSASHFSGFLVRAD